MWAHDGPIAKPPGQISDPDYYIHRTDRLAARYHIFTIEAPGGRRTESELINEDVTAARYGAPAVSIQSQFAVWHPVSEFRPFIRRAVRAIRRASRHVVILAGIATDAGGIPVTPQAMESSYDYALADGAQGFWLNADKWPPLRGVGCAPDGCPQTAINFLQLIDATLPRAQG